MPSASPTTPDLPTPDEVERIAAVGDPDKTQPARSPSATRAWPRSWASAETRARTGAPSPRGPRARPGARSAARTCSPSWQRGFGRDAEVLHPVDALWRTLVRRGLFKPREAASGASLAELHTPFDAFELASDAVARGNRKVFAEIGLEFARFLNECDADAAPDSADVAASSIMARGWSSGPTASATCARPSRAISSQRFEPDAGVRAQLVVLANLEIGFHEQTRLQPEIGAALDAAATTEETSQRRDPAPAPWGAVVQRGLTRVEPRGRSRARSWC